MAGRCRRFAQRSTGRYGKPLSIGQRRERGQAVPVIRQLAEIPECVSPFHGNPATGLMFHSGDEPMDLDKLAQRIVRPAVEAIR